jgi:hypothetical protein
MDAAQTKYEEGFSSLHLKLFLIKSSNDSSSSKL